YAQDKHRDVRRGPLRAATDPNTTTFTYAVGTAPTNGSVTVTPTGSFTYTPAATFFGTDTFTYTASDGTQTSAPATVTVTVNRASSAERPLGNARKQRAL